MLSFSPEMPQEQWNFQTFVRGGPCLMRVRISSGPLGASHMASIHQVAPASAQGRTIAAACSRFSPGVLPSHMISNGVVAVRCLSIYAFIARISSGVISANEPSSFSLLGNKPSQFNTRRMDFILGQAPTTHMGILGVCMGGGRKI